MEWEMNSGWGTRGREWHLPKLGQILTSNFSLVAFDSLVRFSNFLSTISFRSWAWLSSSCLSFRIFLSSRRSASRASSLWVSSFVSSSSRRTALALSSMGAVTWNTDNNVSLTFPTDACETPTNDHKIQFSSVSVRSSARGNRDFWYPVTRRSCLVAPLTVV